MKTLFDKTVIQNMEIKNRLIRSATWENMADEQGHLTDRLVKVYENLAKGGVGLIIASAAYMTQESQTYRGQLGVYNDEFIAEYKKLTDMIHQYGSQVMLQLAYCSLTDRTAAESAAETASQLQLAPVLKPTEVTTATIQSIINTFGAAAARAEQAGFDGVQIHSAHGYTLSQFLNAGNNGRADQYGGSLENRTRFLLEICDAIKRNTSNDFNLFVKINCIDDASNSENNFETCRYACTELAKRGVSAIEISGGRYDQPMPEVAGYQESVYRDYASQIAAAVDIPVIMVRSNRTPEVMSEILNTTEIEYLSLSRPLLCEPDLISRWEQNLAAKPKCIFCNKCFDKAGNICIFNR